MTAAARIHLPEMPEWPAVLTVKEALGYSGLSESELRRRVALGDIVFKAVGPNGCKVCPKSQLDEMIKKIWSEGNGIPPTPVEDLDFGDD